MNLGFLVVRKNHLKHFAGLVEEALGRGWGVTLLCDHSGGQADPRGRKGYEFPHLDSLPAFRQGVPVVEAVRSVAELASAARRRSLDALFCVGGRTLVPALRAALGPGRPLIAQVQSAWDSMMLHVRPDTLDAYDVIYGFTERWIDWWADYQVAYGLVPADERHAWQRALKDKFVPAGFAEAEQAKWLDPERARARRGLPAGRPVVLYLPFPFQSTWHEFWPRRIHRFRRPLQLVNAVLSGDRRWLPYAWHGWNDISLVRRVRAFCDRHGALLVVKSRLKNPIPRHVRRLADRIFYDDGEHPATILELLALSSLCIHYYSFTLAEAAALGVPSLCISPSAEEWPKVRVQKGAVSDFCPRPAPDSFYNFPGVVFALGLVEAFERLPALRLDDLALAPDRRRAFLDKFLGCHDVNVAARVFEDLAARAAAGR
jgi:hypothetical protein